MSAGLHLGALNLHCRWAPACTWGLVTVGRRYGMRAEISGEHVFSTPHSMYKAGESILLNPERLFPYLAALRGISHRGKRMEHCQTRSHFGCPTVSQRIVYQAVEFLNPIPCASFSHRLCLGASFLTAQLGLTWVGPPTDFYFWVNFIGGL